MIVGVIVADPLVVALVAGIPTVFLGYLGIRRANKLDRLAVSSTVLTARSEEAKLVAEGQTDLIANLRTDNKDLRALVEALRGEIRGLYDEIAKLRRDLKLAG